MDTHKLSFASINLVQDDIVEMVVNAGVEVNVPMTEEFHRFLLSHLSLPFSLLINMQNSYSYSPESLCMMDDIQGVCAVGIVADSPLKMMVAEVIVDFPVERQWNVQIFSVREDAIDWVLVQQQKGAIERMMRLSGD